jgi:hypothetical protein
MTSDKSVAVEQRLNNLIANGVDTRGSVTTGFHAGWSGVIKYRKLIEPGLVIITWKLSVAAPTVVANNDLINTLPSSYAYPSDNTVMPCQISGGGFSNAAAFAVLNTSGAFRYSGAGATLSSTAFFYGQAVIDIV